MSGTYAISVSGLVKTFGWARALDGLDLLVRTGEGHGFLGPNGAGKATTLRVLLGLLRPDSDKALLLGGNQWRDATELHRRLAYVPGEVMDLLGRLRGGLDPRRRAEPLDRFEPDSRKKGRAYPTAASRWARWARTPGTSWATATWRKPYRADGGARAWWTASSPPFCSLWP